MFYKMSKSEIIPIALKNANTKTKLHNTQEPIKKRVNNTGFLSGTGSNSKCNQFLLCTRLHFPKSFTRTHLVILKIYSVGFPNFKIIQYGLPYKVMHSRLFPKWTSTHLLFITKRCCFIHVCRQHRVSTLHDSFCFLSVLERNV